MNEEEIKIKYVLPWLAQTGVELQELQFENTFSIRIGRQTIPVAGSPTREKAWARLDILVRRGDKNLLIVETKAANSPLTDDDRDQAISYARLVHPIAPYAVVTNGSKYHLFDSLTKKRLEPSEIRIGVFEAALPDTVITEAQELFLALNPRNLLLFCQAQVCGELCLVKGTVTEPKKYVPDLHVSREAILHEVNEFYRSDLPGLLLVGQSGSGKTCELCSIAESLLARGKPVLFFNGFSLEKDILDAIAKEFSWTFSGTDIPIQAVKRIESFVREDFLTIIVDAIDEWMFESRINHLASLLRTAERRKIKVIVSCKTSAVEQFLSIRGNPTPTSNLSKRLDISPFSPKEFFQVVQIYRRAYQFFGGFEDAALDQARDNPFLLRVLFDVARDSNVRHFTFNSTEFFEAYYERSLRKTSDLRQAGETLKAVALLLYKRNIEWISEYVVRTELGLRVNEPLMEELFEYGILLRSPGEAGESVIGFYFEQLRDYIVAFKAMQFSEMMASSLAKEFKNVKFPCMQGDVFNLYYRLASREHKLIFDGELRANATKYLYCYVSLIQENFPSLKWALQPGTDGRVGFIGELLLSHQCAGAYGFRAVGNSDDEVYFVPVEKLLHKTNLPYLIGATNLHLRNSAYGFRDGIDITTEVVEGELLPQVRQLVEQGRLNESNNPDLLSELIVETVSYYKEIFIRLFTSDQRTVHFPLKINAVLDCLLREKLARHYQGEIIVRKRINREIQEVWNGTQVGYTYSPTPADVVEINKKVEQALSNDKMPILMALNTELEDLQTSCLAAVNVLRRNGSEISAPFFQRPRHAGLVGKSPEFVNEVKVYLCKLYSAFLSNYKTIIDTNFPTLQSYFSLYSNLPLSVYLVLESAVDRDSDYALTPLTVYFVKARLEQSTVQVVDGVDCQRSGDVLHFTIGGVVHEGILCRYATVEKPFGIISGLSLRHFRGMTLRMHVYSTILRELSTVEDEFSRQVRLSRASNIAGPS